MTGRSSRRVLVGLIAACAASLWAASVAGAATVTIGNPATFYPSELQHNGAPITVANFVLTEPGSRVSSPVNGTITQWHVTTTGTGEYVLRVIRQSGSDYAAVGSSPGTVTTAGPNSFSANLPIQTNDLIGVDLPTNQGIAVGLVDGSLWGGWSPTLTSTPTPRTPVLDFTNETIALSADVQYPDPAPPTTAGTTKKKCKKKHKRSASASKKCKKKKK
jgi:hypothetical protein